MQTEDKEEAQKDPTRIVVSSSSGNIEWSSGVKSDTPVDFEWTTVLGGLPDLKPEEAINFYTQAIRSLPSIRVRGFYGAIEGSDEHPDDVTLFLYRDNPETPVLRVVMGRSDILQFVEALNDLVARFGR